jgi:hypothetical protein
MKSAKTGQMLLKQQNFLLRTFNQIAYDNLVCRLSYCLKRAVFWYPYIGIARSNPCRSLQAFDLSVYLLATL